MQLTIGLKVVPVLYAFSLMLVVTAVYAVLASQLFSDRSPEQFGRFSLALLTVRMAPLRFRTKARAQGAVPSPIYPQAVPFIRTVTPQKGSP